MSKFTDLCDTINEKTTDNSLLELFDLIFEETPGDTWWNVKDVYDHLLAKKEKTG